MPGKWDITPHIEEIERSLSQGCSVRMIAKSLGITHTTLSQKMKLLGMKVPTHAESAKQVWRNHKHPYLGKRGAESPSFGKKQSKETVARRISAITGDKNYRWSGGRKKHSGGYILAYAPDHPNRDRRGFVLEHRLVMEQHLGRFLGADEIVHHINENKEDNRIENLELTGRAEHAKHHQEMRYKNYA